MRFYLYMLVNLLFLFPSFGQVVIKGKILDAASGETIAYVNIGVKDQGKGTVSNEDGLFVLKDLEGQNEVIFSSIGYETKQIKVANLKLGQEILMTEVSYELAEMEIKAERFSSEEKLFGVRNENGRGIAIGFGSTQLGTEMGSVIQINKPTYIKSAHFVLNHAKGDSLLFRVNIYSFEKDNIGKQILTENILIRQKQKKGTLTVDLSAYDLILDSNVLLTLEWLKNFDGKGNEGITFDTKKAKKMTGIYLRWTSQADFKTMPFKRKLNSCFYFKGKEVLQ